MKLLWTDDDEEVSDLIAFIRDRKFDIENDIEDFGLLKKWLWIIDEYG